MAYDRLKRLVRESNKRFARVAKTDCAFYPMVGVEPRANSLVRCVEMITITGGGIQYPDGVAVELLAGCRDDAEKALIRQIRDYLRGKSSLLVWRRLPVIEEYDQGGEVKYAGRARLYAE